MAPVRRLYGSGQGWKGVDGRPAVGDAIPRVEFARILGVCTRTLDRWRQKGVLGVRLPAVRVGIKPYFRLCDYQWWQEELERRLEPPPAPRGRTAQQREKGRRQAEEAL